MYVTANVTSDGCIHVNGTGWGYGQIAHRESLNIQDWDGALVHRTLAAAKQFWVGGSEVVLELDQNGAGRAIWLGESQKAEILYRISRWKGCYGAWKVKTFATEAVVA